MTFKLKPLPPASLGRRFFGPTENWHDDCDLLIKGKKYNGRKAFYVFWILVYEAGFYHSTGVFE